MLSWDVGGPLCRGSLEGGVLQESGLAARMAAKMAALPGRLGKALVLPDECGLLGQPAAVRRHGVTGHKGGRV